MLLLRKISINKWPANRDEAIATARDCLSDSANDLRTTEGVASFWDCTDKNVIDILCTNFSLCGNKIESNLYFVIIDSNELDKIGIKYVNTPDKATFKIIGIEKYHYDLQINDMSNLEKMIIYMSNIIISKKEFVYRTIKSDIIKLSLKMNDDNRLLVNSLANEVLLQLGLNKSVEHN